MGPCMQDTVMARAAKDDCITRQLVGHRNSRDGPRGRLAGKKAEGAHQKHRVPTLIEIFIASFILEYELHII